MTAAPTYDRTARSPVVPVLNLPNVLTLGRLLVVPFFAALLLLDGTATAPGCSPRCCSSPPA